MMSEEDEEEPAIFQAAASGRDVVAEERTRRARAREMENWGEREQRKKKK
jgi:hypothetical protein